jgi:hypothetical protein
MLFILTSRVEVDTLHAFMGATLGICIRNNNQQGYG